VSLFRRESKKTDLTSSVLVPATDRKAKETTMALAKRESLVSLKMDEITTILGKGSEFEGKLCFEGTLRIEGSFRGEIRSEAVLVVGEGAEVNAEIHVGTIIINGTVLGNVTATHAVEIRSPGKVVGNLTTPSLSIEKGVVFEGACQMDGSPKKVKAEENVLPWSGEPRSNEPRTASVL
jgi:cytoskeletal protein CcmA (bactofilin family)